MSEASEFYPFRPQPLLVVISGPSGVGKDSVIQQMKARNAPIHFVVTATTRPPRTNEVEGIDYIFVSRGEFADMIDKGELLEYAIVYEDYKGIPKAQVRQALASGKDVIMRIDVQGAETVRKLCPEALLIFLTVQDEEEMVTRLLARKTDSPESLKLRIATARQELNRIEQFDYIVINHEGRLDETVDSILAIIRTEHLRVKQRRVNL